MSLKRYASGAWQDIESVKRYASGAWQDCESAKKYVDGAWQDVWKSGPSFKFGQVGNYQSSSYIPDYVYVPNGDSCHVELKGMNPNYESYLILMLELPFASTMYINMNLTMKNINMQGLANGIYIQAGSRNSDGRNNYPSTNFISQTSNDVFHDLSFYNPSSFDSIFVLLRFVVYGSSDHFFKCDISSVRINNKIYNFT